VSVKSKQPHYLRSKGVSVYTYPLEVSLALPGLMEPGAFGFVLTGPPAAYTILSSLDLSTWNELKPVTNLFGSIPFADTEVTNSGYKFYRAKALIP
jgi:hypothetical protein